MCEGLNNMTKNMGELLVFVGAQDGGELMTWVDRFSRILVFQPLPDDAKRMQQAFQYLSHIEVVNAALVHNQNQDQDKTELVKFYVTEPRSFSSLCDPTNINNIVSTIHVPAIDLGEFLSKHKIDVIDLLICEAEGNEPAVLRSILPWLQKQNIKCIRCPVTKNGGLQTVHDILQPHQYQLCGISLDSNVTVGQFDENMPNNTQQFHTLWTPKQQNQQHESLTFLIDLKDPLSWKKLECDASFKQYPLIVICDNVVNENDYIKAWKILSERNLLSTTFFHHDATIAKSINPFKTISFQNVNLEGTSGTSGTFGTFGTRRDVCEHVRNLRMLHGNTTLAYDLVWSWRDATDEIPEGGFIVDGRQKSEEGWLWRERMICSWLTNDLKRARMALDRCIDYDVETYECAGRWVKHMAIRLVNPKDGRKSIEVPIQPRPNLINGNLSILPYTFDPPTFIANSRMINWINNECRHPERILTNENAIVILNEQFQVIREDALIDVSQRKTQKTGWTGFEDVRLYEATHSTLRFMCTIFDHEGGSRPQMARCLAVYTGQHRWETVHVQPLARIDPMGEKNWLTWVPSGTSRPFTKMLQKTQDDPATVYSIYHWYPRYHVLKIFPNGQHATLFKDATNRGGSFHQGSCAPIWFEPLKCWLALIHLSWDVFYHRFVLLDQDTLEIRKIGPIFYLDQLGVEYCCGMCYDHKQQNIILSYGKGDSSSHILPIPILTVLQHFQ
jgi:FkbM family methyltransferase